VYAFHRCLVEAIRLHEPEKAVQIMSELLTHGEQHLFAILGKNSKED